jgi:misacylated tRNA(Ala) deacylase
VTEALFRADAYLRRCDARVVSVGPAGVLLDRTVFYPLGGGQAGDAGTLTRADGLVVAIADTRKSKAEGAGPDDALHVPSPDSAEAAASLKPGDAVVADIDWDRRHRLMRMHTALHLLSVVIPLPVTGGQIGADRGRLDFDMPEPPEDIGALNSALNALIDADLPVTESWITDAELAANPGLVKTMSVAPPVGQGRVRLVKIGDIDLQPCGGTHVARTGEIGRVSIGKIEKKGRQNRRVSLTLDN